MQRLSSDNKNNFHVDSINISRRRADFFFAHVMFNFFFASRLITKFAHATSKLDTIQLDYSVNRLKINKESSQDEQTFLFKKKQ